MSAGLETAREAVIKAAIQLVYDGMSDAAWQRVRRAVEAMEAAGFQYRPEQSETPINPELHHGLQSFDTRRRQ